MSDNKFANEEARISYCLGLNFAMQAQQIPVALDSEEFMKGFLDMLDGKAPEVTQDEFSAAMKTLQSRIQEQDAHHDGECHCESCHHDCGGNCGGEENKKAGDDYRAENAKNPSVITLESGLQYEVLTEGTGKAPKASDTVRVHYTGKLIDGTVFDSSVQRGEPLVFSLNQVIKGWTEGLQLMKEGGKAILTIPPEIGYGEHGAGNVIPPQATLIFEVELLKVL